MLLLTRKLLITVVSKTQNSFQGTICMNILGFILLTLTMLQNHTNAMTFMTIIQRNTKNEQ
jgi:hypothetical protein